MLSREVYSPQNIENDQNPPISQLTALIEKTSSFSNTDYKPQNSENLKTQLTQKPQNFHQSEKTHFTNLNNEPYVNQSKNLTLKNYLIEKRKKIWLQHVNNENTSLSNILSQTENVTICSSLIYHRQGQQWKNRKVINLTINKIDHSQINKITKIKIKNEEPLIGCKLLRLTLYENKTQQYAIKNIDSPQWFSNIIWTYYISKGIILSKWNISQKQLSSFVYKKSEILGIWQPRYIEINEKKGLTSCRIHKTPSSPSPSLFIKSTTQLWTRLQTTIFQKKEYVIFKMWKNLFKIQIAVPLESTPKWAGCLAHLII